MQDAWGGGAMMKMCTTCGEEKSLDKFSRRRKAKDGHQARCKACALLKNQKYRKSEKGKAVVQRRIAGYQAAFDPSATGIKACARCGQEKDFTEFHRNCTQPDGRHYYCKVCSLLAIEKYCESEAGYAKRKAYRESEEGKAKIKEYRESSAGKASGKKYYESETGQATHKKYLQSEEVKASVRRSKERYKKTTRGKLQSRKSCRKRRAIKLGVTIGTIDENAIYKFCGNKCAYCGSTKNLSLDHIVALSKGGAHCESNLLVACRSCNSSKGTKPVAEWLATRPMAISKSLKGGQQTQAVKDIK